MSANQIRVLCVTHSVSREGGGIFTAVMRLMQNMNALGVDTRVFGLRDPSFEFDRRAWSPLRPRAHETFGPKIIGYSPLLESDVRHDVNADSLIHLHGLWKATSATCSSLSERLDLPRIVTPHGMLHEWALHWHSSRKRLAMALYESRNLRGTDCIHALCEEEMATIRNLGFRNRIAVIPNGVDMPDRNPMGLTDPVPPPLRDRRILLFLSRLHPKKGLVPLLHAWARCFARHPDWALVIAGPDEDGHQAEIEWMISELRISGSVLVPGPQYDNHKHAWLCRANAFVLSSFSEGLPSAILEAMSYKLPVLQTPQCNFAEGVACGAAVSAEPTVESLVHGLDRLLSRSDAELAMMGTSGRDLIQRSYSWCRVAETMISVYRWLLGRGPQPDCIYD